MDYTERTQLESLNASASTIECDKFWDQYSKYSALNPTYLQSQTNPRLELETSVSNTCTDTLSSVQSSELPSHGSSKSQSHRSSDSLSHVDVSGKARMVDVSWKPESLRTATARASVLLDETCYKLIAENRMKKGDVLLTARLAGIMAAKRTADLIPLCHPIPIEHVDVTAELRSSHDTFRHQESDAEGEKQVGKFASQFVDGASFQEVTASTTTSNILPTASLPKQYSVEVTATVTTVGRTGVEMEALTAATVAALTVYDMCKAVTHDLTITRVQLVAKAGGKRDFQRRE